MCQAAASAAIQKIFIGLRCVTIAYSRFILTVTLHRGASTIERRTSMNTKHILKLLLLAALLIIFSTVPVTADEFPEDQSNPDMIYLRGLVSKVSTDDMQISVKPPTGKSVRISIDPDTILEGVDNFGGFEKEQQVKVWYKEENGLNRALKIIKMMELGC
jgi:hypothetical protein